MQTIDCLLIRADPRKMHGRARVLFGAEVGERRFAGECREEFAQVLVAVGEATALHLVRLLDTLLVEHDGPRDRALARVAEEIALEVTARCGWGNSSPSLSGKIGLRHHVSLP